MSRNERRDMVKPKQKLSIVHQCKLLDIHRSGVYHRPKPASPINLALMREIDEIHINRPFLGVRRITDELCGNGHQINANLIVKWKKLLLENSGEVFASGKGLAPDRESEIKSLQAKIGEITMENDFLSKALGH